MAKWFRAPAALAEELGSIPGPRRQLTDICNFSYRVSEALTWPLWRTYIHEDKTFT